MQRNIDRRALEDSAQRYRRAGDFSDEGRITAMT
jgi:hypothetical protein